MKKLLLAFTLFLSFNSLFASHFAGGEIWYEYSGDPQNPNRYDVYVIVYRDISGVTMCPNYCPVQICVTSSCFPTMTVTAPLDPFIIQSGSDTAYGSYPGSILALSGNQCVTTNSANLISTEVYRFHTQIDLPGTCSDFTFTYSQSSRNSSSNMVGQGYFHIAANLNNTLGHNSSARFLSSGSRSFCAGVPTIWQQSAMDPDGDSLYYELGEALSGSCLTPTPSAYASGYSANSPITTANGINLNHQTGVISFTPTQVEVVVVNIRVKEYRFNSAFNQWLLISSTMRDMQIPIVSNSDCSAPPQTWFNMREPSSDTITSTLKCNDSILEIAFEQDILTSTIAPDGTDFALLTSNGTIIPITAATYRQNLLQTRKIKLHLDKPIYYNDTLALITRVGSDLNTLQTICSNAIPAGDSLMLSVTGCNTSISTEEIYFDEISLYPNPANSHLSFVTGKFAKSTAEIEITDYTGKVVVKKSNHSLSEDLNISELPAGGYLIHLYSNQWIQTLKFEKL